MVSGASRGDIGWSHEFNQALLESGLEKNFIFLGEIKFYELPWYYSAADIIVYPSTFEGFGLPALEALACERPFLGTRTGEMPYIIKDGYNGLLVDVSRPDQLRIALEKLIYSKDTRDALASKARQSITNYSWQNLAKSIATLHQQALNEADNKHD